MWFFVVPSEEQGRIKTGALRGGGLEYRHKLPGLEWEKRKKGGGVVNQVGIERRKEQGGWAEPFSGKSGREKKPMVMG